MPLVAACGEDADSEAEDADEPAAGAAAAPPPAAAEPGAPEATLAETFAGDPELTVFGRVFEASRLAPEFERQAVTILAPTNAAFSTVTERSVAGEANARSFVLRHTLSGTLDRAALQARTDVRPREGGALGVRVDGESLWIGEARITETRRVGDTVIHIIGRVIE